MKWKLYSANYIIHSHGANMSDIMNMAVHLAGRLCESYAGDIVVLLEEYWEKVKLNQPYDAVLVFRQNGIDSYIVEQNTISVYGGDFANCAYLQLWRLTWDNSKKCGRFERVAAREVKENDE